MPSLQGVAMGRRSQLHMEVDGAPGAITRVRVGGQAVPSAAVSCSVISFARISRQYGRQVLFVEASFELNPGEKVGCRAQRRRQDHSLPDDRGRGGRGRRGGRRCPKRMTIGYFRQDVEEMAGGRCWTKPSPAAGASARCITNSKLQHAMADPARADELDSILERFGTVQEDYDHLGGYGLEAQAREVLHGLGFDDELSTATSARCRAAGRCAWRWRACCWAGRTSC